MQAIAGLLENPQASSSRPASGSDCGCEGLGWVQVLDAAGNSWGVTECLCLRRRKLASALDRIPALYRPHRLPTLEPAPELHPKQPLLISQLREEPEASYLLVGRQGCGKSLVGWLLYRHAVESGRPAIGMQTADLLAQFRRWEREGITPVVEPEELRRERRRWLIFLDEFDKPRPSEFAGEMLFAVLDAVYGAGHQLVITANLDSAGLRSHWSRANETYGPSIMRRVMELADSVEVEMF